MNKIFGYCKLVFKGLLLLVILGMAWLVSSGLNLFKGGSSPVSKDGEKYSGLFNAGATIARADHPPSTPFLAYFDGSDYKIENDVLVGRPKSYYPDYNVARSLYEDGRIAPDLYKITSPLKEIAGKLLFQLHEIETEESFFKWIRLSRVIHPKGTEIIVDSEYKKFYVVPRTEFEKSVIVPSSVKSGAAEVTNLVSDRADMFNMEVNPQKPDGVFVDSGNYTEVLFNGLNKDKPVFLIVKSWYRDWMIGLEEDWQEKRPISHFSIFSNPALTRPLAALALIVGSFILERRGLLGSVFLAPFFMGDSGSGPGDAPGDGDTGDSPGASSGSGACGGNAGACGSASGGSVGCCLVYEYLDATGTYRRTAITEPRAWRYNLEMIELPEDAVLQGGEMRLRIKSSKKHNLGFVAVTQDFTALGRNEYQKEDLPLISAMHDRNGESVESMLKDERAGGYVQTLPGDKVSLEFAASQTKLGETESETYLFHASGFYTALRGHSRNAIGNWQEKISAEAKARLSLLKNLSNYA